MGPRAKERGGPLEADICEFPEETHLCQHLGFSSLRPIMDLIPASGLYDNNFVLFYVAEFVVVFMMAIGNSFAGKFLLPTRM